MISKFAIRITKALVNNHLIEDDAREYYEYTIQTVVEKWIAIISIVLIGLILGRILHTTLFLVFFMMLKSRTGGYHSDSFCKCYLETIISYITVFLLGFVLIDNIELTYIISLLCSVYIFAVGTINHPNLNLDIEEYNDSKKVGRLILFIEIVVIAAFSLLDVDSAYLYYMCASIILSAVSMSVARIFGQEVKAYEGSI